MLLMMIVALVVDVVTVRRAAMDRLTEMLGAGRLTVVLLKGPAWWVGHAPVLSALMAVLCCMHH